MELHGKPTEGWPWPLIGAGALTVIWFGFLLWLVGQSDVCSNGIWYELYVQCLKPNEVGDLLAGAFAPVAFFWVAAAVFIQAQELKAQRAELRESRLAATSQAKTASAQLETLLAEQADRSNEKFEEGIFASLEAILFEVVESPLRLFFVNGRQRGEYIIFKDKQLSRSLSEKQKWKWLADQLETIVITRKNEFDLEKNEGALQVADRIERLVESRERLSLAGKSKLDGFQLSKISQLLRTWGNGRPAS
jgi:hypothetical protein